MKSFIFFLFVFSTTVFATSAFRPQGVDYHTLARRHTTLATGQGSSAYDLATSFNKLNIAKLPAWKDQKTLAANFQYVRNLAFLDDPEEEQAHRRSSWFYPDDGCWVRAQLMNENLKKKKQTLAAKIFIFGNLSVKTKFSPSGEVGWWYHVVPIVRIGQKAYVMDPAITSGAPLPLKTWILKQVSNVNEASYSICHPNTFGPGDECLKPVKTPLAEVEELQASYLMDERSRLEELGLSTEKYLGKSPPW